MHTRSIALRRFAMNAALAAMASVMLGACSSDSGYNPFKRMGDSTYERDQRQQRGQEPARNPSHIEQQKRGGQDSG